LIHGGISTGDYTVGYKGDLEAVIQVVMMDNGQVVENPEDM
jgi:hypothetical protein